MAVSAQTFYVKFNGFLNEFQNLFAGFSRSNTTWEVRNVSPEASFTFFDNDGISHIHTYFKPACFRILFSVPGGMSMPGFPDTVTVPGFVRCLN